MQFSPRSNPRTLLSAYERLAKVLFYAGHERREEREKIVNLQRYHAISQKQYKLALKLLQNMSMKSYAVYQTVPFLMTLSKARHGFQGQGTFQQLNISEQNRDKVIIRC